MRFLAIRRPGRWSVVTVALIGFAFRDLIHRHVLLRFWEIRETDIGDFSQRKRSKQRVAVTDPAAGGKLADEFRIERGLRGDHG